jgi:hypothetical protein
MRSNEDMHRCSSLWKQNLNTSSNNIVYHIVSHKYKVAIFLLCLYFYLFKRIETKLILTPTATHGHFASS